MRVFKPDTIHHEGNPVLSICVDKGCKRIATCGGGESSGLICIWDATELLIDLLKKEVEIIRGSSSSSSSYFTKLAELTEHQDCVNCVRWSPDGTVLVSGSDDKTVIIWNLVQPRNISEELTLINREYWKSSHKLLGHTGDVLDISWSICGRMIASASVDNTIIIWDARNLPNVITKLSSHKSFVKGVAFDPVGEYLASQSEDNSLMIWSVPMFTSSSRQVKPYKIISEPFQKVSGATQFLRLAWSPEGSYLISAHASNNSAPVSAIINRTDWSSDLCAVGHKAAICCVSFNPQVYQNASTKEYVIVCATASRDGALAIWKFPSKRPLCVIHRLFESSIMDLSWTSDGRALLICSHNGSVCVLDFDESKEFSEIVLSREEVKDLRHAHISGTKNVVGENVPIPTNPRFVKCVETPKSECSSSNKKKKHPLISNKSSQLSSAPPTTVAKGDLKRIKPTLLAAPNKRICESGSMNDEELFEAPSSIAMNRMFGNTINIASIINPVTKHVIVPSVTVPKIREELTMEINLKKGIFSVSAKNDALSDAGGCVLSAELDNKQLWCQQVISKIAILKLTSKHIIYVTDEDQIFFINHDGWAVMPNLLLPTGSAGLFIHEEKFVFAVQKTATFYLWNIEEKKALYADVKLPFVANKKKRVHLIHLTIIESSNVMAIYDDQSVYIYHEKLKSWSVICNQFSSVSSLKPYLMATVDRTKDTELSQLTEAFASIMKDEGSFNDEKYSISFFMNQLSTLLFMKLKEEFLNTFIIFVQYLSDRNNEKLLRRLCEHVNDASMNTVDMYRDNIDEGGKKLLSIILRVIERNINLQNVYRKYELYV